MKIKLTLILACFLVFAKTSTAQNLAKIIEDLSKEISSSNGDQIEIRTVVTKTLTVNSASNARLYNSKTRDVVKVELPVGTKKWFYRITVLEIDKNYSYQNNETLFYLLNNRKTMDTYAPTNEGVDFYILGHSGEVESFKKTGNDSFKAFTPFTKIDTNSFTGECALTQENIWIGIKNPNSFVGLKVIVEVVSFGI